MTWIGWTSTVWGLLEGVAVTSLILLGAANWPLLLRAASGQDRSDVLRKGMHIVFWSVLGAMATFTGVVVAPFAVDLRDVASLMGGLTGGPLAGAVIGILGAGHQLATGGPTALVSSVPILLAGIVAGLVGRGRAIQKLPAGEAVLAVLIVELLHAGATLFLVQPIAGAVEYLQVAVLPATAVMIAGTLVHLWILVSMLHRADVHDTNRRLLALTGGYLRSTLDLIAGIADAKDPHTASHSRRVADYAVTIGKRIGLSDQELETLWIAGVVHDIGKIAVPNEILVKQGAFSDIERQIMQSHAPVGARVLQASRGALRELARFADRHHEHYGGGGYPQGIKQRDLLVSILTVADALEAMTSQRPYREALPLPQVIEEFRRGSGHQFDPEVVAPTLALLETAGPPHQWPAREPVIGSFLGLTAGRG
ncbi:MAG TPA: HD domain-containing phosphohydrolase [Bacillota bacterium]|nr:HD domain-containing phosphohydrolase [Bacillota bacterium]